MKRLKKFFSRWNYIIITIFSALIIIGVVFYLQKVAPFGNHSLLTVDFYHQYGPMLGEYYDRIKNFSNLFYSFNMGMGLPFFTNFFNYMSSPYNLLLLFLKRSDIVMGYSFIIGLKAICSCLTMVLFLKNKFKKKNMMFIPLSLFYGFNAYFIAYYWNIMWLDGMVLLPLITLGIEKLVDDRKPLLYIITLSTMLFANYFIAYMLCIFSVLYFLIYILCINLSIKWKDVFKRFLLFAGSSIIAGGICAFFILPLYSTMTGISATGDTFPTSQYYGFTALEFIYNHFSGVGSTVFKSDITNAPNISCGIIPILLLVFFIVNKKIKLNIKIGYGLLLVFLIFSYFFAPLDFIWHAFHVPNDLPYRYSFIYPFIMIIIGGYSINEIKSVKPIWGFISFIIVIIFIGTLYIVPFKNIKDGMKLLNFLVISIWFLCYIIYVYFYKHKSLLPYICIITTILECIISINNVWDVSQDMVSFYSDYDYIEEDLAFIKKNDDSMYRVERSNMHTFNDPSWYNYYGQEAFSSMEYENMASSQQNLGIPGNNINSFYYSENTPIYNIMFNLKYIIGDVTDTNRYSLYYNNEENVYRFNYNIGLMYGVSNKVKEWECNYGNAILNQSDFIEKTSGISGIFKLKDDYKKETVYNNEDTARTIVKYKFSNTNNAYYLYYESYDVDFIVIDDILYYFDSGYEYVYDVYNLITDYVNLGENRIITVSKDVDEIYIGYSYYNEDKVNAYEIDNDKLDNVYANYINNIVNITDFEENYIKGSIVADTNMSIYTSIPYDEGWNVYIDGDKVKTYSNGGSLLGFDIDSGSHTIELKYNIPYFKTGLIVSGISLLALIILNKKKSLEIF